jgi:hypothetical protein
MMRNQATKWLRRGKVGALVLLRWTRQHTILAAVALLVTAIIAPRQVQGQLPSPCCAILATGLGTINSSLINVVGGGLQAINTVMTDIRNFEQTVIWPQQAIARALGLAEQIQGSYVQIRTIFQVPIASATLANPRQLESVLLSRNAGQIPKTTAGYAAVYGTVPTPQNAPPPVRDMIDITDAAAQDAMERAIAIDAIADQEFAAADQINANVQSATPGSAPLIEAQADAWLVRAHAYTQSALSDLMRVRAIDLANNGAHLKLGSAWAVNTQQDVTNSLQHR